MLKKMFFAFALAGLLCAAPAFQWRSVKINGMGYVSGVFASPQAPHDIYVRTDVGGAYRLDRTTAKWIPLLDGFSQDDSAQNVESITFDPKDGATLYSSVAWNTPHLDSMVAEVIVSHDKGSSWQPLGLAERGLSVGGNAYFSGTTGERLAVDPRNRGRLFYGTHKDGLWNYNGHAWHQVHGGLPAVTEAPGFVFVVADPGSQNVYAGVYKSGVWVSKDGGATWSNSGPAANPLRGVLGADGTLFVVFGSGEGSAQGSGGAVQKFRAGTWTNITPAGGVNNSFSGLTVDPADPKTLVAGLVHDMKFWRSSDQGASWKAIPNSTSAAHQPGYYAISSPKNPLEKAANWGDSSLLIDPAQPKRLYSANGYGVLVTEDMTAEPPAWAWLMENLNELVVQQIKVPPVANGADLLSVTADMIGFRHASRDKVPAESIGKFDWVAQGVSLAYSAAKPEYAAFVGWDQPTKKAKTGFTSDNGKTWEPFANVTPGSGGNIAMAAKDPMNLVWAPAAKTPIVYSKDGGRSWKQCRAGEGLLPQSWQLNNLWWSPQVLAADMILPNTFYFYANGAFFASRDGGANWDKVSTIEAAGPPVGYTIKAVLVTNPVKAGDIWLTLARNPNQSAPFRLLHSADGGKTFGVVESLARCSFIAFGKGNNERTPFLYAYGRARPSDYDGIFKSEDMGLTWLALSDNTQQFPSITTLEGDMRTKDLVYAGTAGRGIIYGFGPASGIAAGAPAH
jgi:xyloglucan-specific exo-beta-1,4-glucanase